MEKLNLREYRYDELLREISNESIEIILNRDTTPATGSKKEWGFDTKHYFITVNISVTEKGYLSPGDYETPDEYVITKRQIDVELISIHLDETKIVVGEYLDGLVGAIEGILNIY